MSTGCQKDRQRDRQTARQTDRQKDRQKNRKKDRKIFQLTHQNKRCSECQLDVRKIERQKYRQTDRKIDTRQKDFSAYLSKQKLLRKSTGCQKDRKTDQQTDR